MLQIQLEWLHGNAATLAKAMPEAQRPYLVNGVLLWSQALAETKAGRGVFAAHVLRSILERAAFVWATSASVGADHEEIISGYDSHDRKTRRGVTDELLDAAAAHDPEVVLLYDEILSRYYNHLSNIDGISVDQSKKAAPKLSARLACLFGTTSFRCRRMSWSRHRTQTKGM